MHLAFCFTFQSGYIQIILFMKSLAVLQALHSNLVIFKWLSKIVRWILYVLYIPIWLYSNDIDKLADSILHFFTFQSGYIQITVKQDVIFSKKTLHSNLVIFKLSRTLPHLYPIFTFTFQSGYIQMKRRIQI